MRTKFDGQNLMLIVILALILMLSYCSIPPRDQTQTHPKASVVQDEADRHEDLSVKDAPAVEEATEEADAVAEKAEETVEASAVEEKTEEAAEAPAVEETTEEVVESPAVEETAVEPPAAEEKEAAAEKAEGAAAASDMPDVIAMENSAYAKHKKGIVQFTHQKHVADYNLGCGECHHDDSGEPLTDLKPGDEIVGCMECHEEPGKAPKSKGKKLSDSERLEYHAEALHMNCISCHKAFNKENNTKDAPASCGKCHPKK